MKVLWTFDPFEENEALRMVGSQIVTNFFESDDEIIAVYVATPGENRLTHAFDVPKSERYSAYPLSLIKKELQELDLEQVDVQVLYESSPSITRSVKALVNYASDVNADLILISTHGNSFLHNMILGSFAEKLMEYAQTDLLFYNEDSELPVLISKSIDNVRNQLEI